MADFSNMLAFAPELLRSLPFIMQVLQATAYIVFIMFFGSVIMRGFRGYLPWHVRLLARVGFGFIALICGIALSPFISIGATGIFGMFFAIFQVGVVIGCIISAAVLTVSLFLISRGLYNIKAIEKAIEKLKSLLEKAKEAERDLAGKTLKQKILKPTRIAGIAVLAALLVFGLANFRGFPNQTELVLSSMGLTMGDLQNLSDYMDALSPEPGQSMPEGCVSPLELAQNFQESIIQNDLPVYADSGIRNLIEGKSGESIAIVYRVEYKQRVYALAITTRQSICSATGTSFCGCINLGSLG
jgi:hypothetical protein